jgi:ATP-dependent DNA ligase
VILEELRAIRRKTCPFRTVPDLRDEFRELPDMPPQWVQPSLVVAVECRQRLRNGLRHAALKGVRPDKRPRVIRRSLDRRKAHRRSGGCASTVPTTAPND